jgi:hypothetical protein
MDEVGAETSWEIVFNSDPSIVVASGDGYTNNQVATESGCIPDDCYRFKIFDSGNNGMCCSPLGVGGSYKLSIGTNTLGEGGEFDSEEIVLFGTCKSLF